MNAIVGGIEAGGTKFVCAIGEPPDHVYKTTRFPTSSPDRTLQKTRAFFRRAEVELDALGIASFGPLDPDPGSPAFGTITTTPKQGWQQVDFVGRMREHFNGPIGFDTDVNAAALAEYRWGRARDLDSVVYVTVGTGIGGGGIIQGNRLHGRMHPEMGHMHVPRTAVEDDYSGACPYHGDCLEGLASGKAIEDRWGCKGESLPEDHRAWELEAHYLAHGVVNITCVLSPERIILGGGVMNNRESLFPMIRTRAESLLSGYLPDVQKHLDTYITPPAFQDRTGVLGAMALATEKLRGQ